MVLSLAVLVCYVYDTTGLIEDGNQPNVLPVETEKNVLNFTERTGRTLHKECNTLFSAKCLKIHVLSFLEDLSSRDELPLLMGLSIVRENFTDSISPEEIALEMAKQPGKPEEKLNKFLLYRLQNYLDGHSLRYKLLDPQTTKEAMEMAKGDQAVGRGKGGGGGLGGGKGGGGALLATALMLKGKHRAKCYYFVLRFDSNFRFDSICTLLRWDGI